MQEPALLLLNTIGKEFMMRVNCRSTELFKLHAVNFLYKLKERSVAKIIK